MALTQISTAGVKDDAVTAGKIPADAVGSSEIAANAVGSSELADDAVDTAAIAADAVTGAKIADDAINSEHYTDGSIDTAHIADSQVTTAKVADDAVTAAKLASNSVVNASVDASAAIAGTKISPDFGSQAISTTNDSVTIGDSIIHSGDTNTKIRFPAADTISFECAGEEVLKINRSSSELLRISGPIDGSTQQEFGIGIAVNDTHTHPAAKITFKEFDASDSRGDLLFYTRGTNNDVASTERLRIDSSGNVGIGTSSPDRTIHCHNSSNTTNVRTKFSNGTTGEGASDGFEIGINGSDPAEAVLVNYEASPMAFFTNATERMRITSAGNVEIDSFSSPSTRTLSLRTGYAANANGGLGIAAKDHSGSAADGLGIYGTDGVSIHTANAGTVHERIRVDTSGNIRLPFVDGSTGLRQKIQFVTESPHFDEVGYIAMNRTAVSSAPSDMVFATGTAGSASERMRILSGGGITFNGDTAEVNALDDYEEGLWTPTVIAGNPVPSISDMKRASYVKIGRLVTVSAYFVMANTSSNTDSLVVGGLPFTARGSNRYSYGVARVGSMDPAPIVQINTNATDLSIMAHSGSSTVWNNAINTYIIFSATYEAA